MTKFSSAPARANAHQVVTTTKTQIPTYEGGVGYERDAKSQLFLLAVSNFVRETTFYESASARRSPRSFSFPFSSMRSSALVRRRRQRSRGSDLWPRCPMVSFWTLRRHSSSLVLASFTTWNGSATWVAAGSFSSNTAW